MPTTVLIAVPGDVGDQVPRWFGSRRIIANEKCPPIKKIEKPDMRERRPDPRRAGEPTLVSLIITLTG
jgi:hypothetical protein